MTVISIIMPVLDEAACIEAQLRGLQGWRRQGHEVIVVDGGSSDGTATLARPLADQVVHSAPGRSLQMNRGAEQASGDTLLFLHADTTLPANAPALVATALPRQNAGWGWFDVRLDAPELIFRVIAACMNRRARLSRVCTGDQAMFISTSLFRAIGGFPPLPLMEDVAMSKLLRERVRPAVIGVSAVTSSRRWRTQGVWRTVRLMWKLRLLYFLGVSPRRLVRLYYPQRKVI